MVSHSFLALMKVILLLISMWLPSMQDSSGWPFVIDKEPASKHHAAAAGQEEADDEPAVQPSVPKTTHMPVLMYHKIDDNGKPNTAVIASDRFREHMEALKDAGYETIFEEELAAYARHGGGLAEKPILITFDDGYLDNYVHAFPILKELDMKASIYVIVSYRGKKPGWNEHFDWEQAREMIDSGHISIQSHSYASHHIHPATGRSYLTGKLIFEDGSEESDEDYANRVKNDMLLSKQTIEHETGQRVISFSYPFGHYNDQTEQWLQEAGYEMSFSVHQGLYRFGDPLWKIPRISVDGNWSGKQLLAEIESLHP